MVTTSISDTTIFTTSTINQNVVMVTSSTSGDNSAIMSLTLMISTSTNVTSVKTIDSYSSSDIVILATSTPVVASSMMSTAAAADAQSGSDSNDIPLGIIAGCIIGVVLCIILLLVVILLWCYLKRRKVALDLPQAYGD